MLTLIALSIGIAVSLLVLIYVYYELSYDRNWSDSGNIYRAYSFGDLGDDKINSASTPSVLGTVLARQEGVEEVTRVIPGTRKVVRGEGIKSMESSFFYVDSNFFEVFDLPFVSGNKDDFKRPDAIVISLSTSQRLFGERNPIGETLGTQLGVEYVIVGVVGDFPGNSHLSFDFAANWCSLELLLRRRRDLPQAAMLDNWLYLNTYTYLKLAEGVGEEAFDKLLAEARHKLDSSIVSSYISQQEDSGRVSLNIGIQPIHDIHLFSELENELKPPTSPLYVKVFTIILLFVLLMTALNFINLTTAKASRRYKEVAVRKYFGAGRRKLIYQFLIEAIVYSLIATFVALVMVELLLPAFNRVFDIEISSAGFIKQPDTIWILVLTMLLGITAGAYPAVFFSGLKPQVAIKGSMKVKRWGVVLRGLLVSFQVGLTACLLVLSFGMYKQLAFLRSAEHGFNSDNAVVVELDSSEEDALEQFVVKLESLEELAFYGRGVYVPGDDPGLVSFRRSDDSTQVLLLAMNHIDEGYLDALGAELQAGRGIDAAKNNEFRQEALINEAAADFLGFSAKDTMSLELVGGRSSDDIQVFDIVGVVANISHTGIKNSDRPMIFLYDDNTQDVRYVVIRFKEGMSASGVEALTLLWGNTVSDMHIELSYLNEIKEGFYKDDKRFSQISLMFGLVALLLTAFSIISMAAFEVQYYRKNIFIRSIMAAPFRNLLLYGLRNFCLYVALGIAAAIPVSDFLLHLWLDDYLKSFNVSLYVFIIPLASMLLISLFAGFLTASREIKRELYS